MAQLFVSKKNESPPMFKNKFIDFFSRVYWWMPLVIFLPIIGYFLYQAFAVVELTWWLSLALVGAGLLVWSFVEYTLHRFLFHWKHDSDWGRRLHFLVHGVHHDYPNDRLRLVMPPAVSLGTGVFFFVIIYLIAGATYTPPVFAGLLIGYLFYDNLHYAVHHVKSENKWFKKIQKHHIKHHYSTQEKGFGFTTTVWDKVFGTDFE